MQKLWAPLKQKYGFILVKLGNLFHMKAKHVRYDNLSVHLEPSPERYIQPFFLAFQCSFRQYKSTKPGFKQLLVFIGQQIFMWAQFTDYWWTWSRPLKDAHSSEGKEEVTRQTAMTVGNVNGHWWLNRNSFGRFLVFGQKRHCASCYVACATGRADGARREAQDPCNIHISQLKRLNKNAHFPRIKIFEE